ncbi:MAG: sugar porter family MFS transporter [Bacteroidota bacterium]
MAIFVKTELNAGSVNVVYNRNYVYIITCIAALGGVLFGFDLVIISGTVPFFKSYFNLDAVGLGWAVGCINLGAAIGAMLAGWLSDKLGRKKLLMFSGFLFALTGIGTGWAAQFDLFVLSRILSGVAVGLAALVCPMYVAEISPSPIRGRMVSFYQLSIVIGILLAYLSNYLLLNSGINNWRWMFSSQAIPSLFFFTGLFFVAESPRWLIGKERVQEAFSILQRIGGDEYARIESKQIVLSYQSETKESFKELFKKNIRPILYTGICIAIFSQAVGQNSLFSYAPELFKQAGMAESSAFFQSIIIGVITFLFTFIAIFKIDKTGRKKLLKYGAMLLGLDAVALAYSFYFHLPSLYVLTFLLCFIAIYSATLGPVTWVVLSEIFPNRIRGNAMSLATLALWITNFFTTASFPVLKEHLGLPLTFTIHAGICFLYFIFIITRIPETKGKSLEEIEKLLVK